MRMDPITSTPNHTPSVPAFTFLFASDSAARGRAKKDRPSWLSRPALRSKRV